MRGRSAPADNRSGSGLLRRSRAWRRCLQGRRRWRTSAPDDESSTSESLPWVQGLSGPLVMDYSLALNAGKATARFDLARACTRSEGKIRSNLRPFNGPWTKWLLSATFRDGYLHVLEPPPRIRTDKHPVMPGSLTPARGFIGFVLFESGVTKEALAEFGATTVREQNRYNEYVGRKWNSHLPRSRNVTPRVSLGEASRKAQ